MANDEISQREKNRAITSALNYVKEITAKTSLERNKRVAEELYDKNLPKESILAVIIKEIPVEKFNEEEITKNFGGETASIAKTL